MQFTREPATSVTIRNVERGAIRIGETVYERTVAMTAERVLADWTGPGLDELTIEHLQPLLDAAPEIVVIGTGWLAALPPRELTFAMARRGVGLEIMDTPAACRTFNILVGEGRKPAAILMID